MATEVKVPPMGESISSGVLAVWKVKDGDTVKRDQPLYDLETDKITSEGVAEADGVIRIKVAEGSEVTIGQVLAEIEAGSAGSAPAAAPKAVETKPAAETKAAESGDYGRAPAAAANAEAEAKSTAPELPVSPAVRRIATESGVSPAAVEGTGKGGRVTKGDMLQAVENFQKREPEAPVAAAPAKAEPAGERPTSRKKMTPLRQRIAQRLVSSQKEAAILSTFNEVDMSAVRDLRAKHQDTFTKQHGIKLGFMSFFVKAVVAALRDVPAVNAQIEGSDTIVQNHFFDIGVAVSTEKGLMVPVVRNCDQLSFADIEKQLAEYAKKAREGKIKIEDLEGGVFTISNGGIFGSLLSTPIINPPQSGILGMHSIQDRPVAVNGQVVIRPMMYLALSYDHRIVDGREAVTFLVKVKQAIEDPARLLLGV
jgi:2-oxoglutarate dehydrogenase E2 component (dihydrolipoamide succinyltransferase)